MLKPVVNFVLASLTPCDVPNRVRLGFSLAAASLAAGLSILEGDTELAWVRSRVARQHVYSSIDRMADLPKMRALS
jgi:hypothetical protein